MDAIENIAGSIAILLFAFLFGTLLQGVERKLFARMQGRIGPPILQPLYDILKLLSKETIIPRKAIKPIFVLAPLVSAAAIATAVLLVPIARVSYWGFAGDLFVLIYVIALSSIGIVLGASASGSPYSTVGASREITLMISFELPMALVLLSVAFFAKSFSLGAMDAASNIFLLLGAIVYFACMLGELGRAPFNIAEAETEIVEGVYTEYSGRLLAAYKVAEALKFYAFPMLFATLFIAIPEGETWLMLFLQMALALFAAIMMAIVEAMSARLKIHQASGFYLKGMLLLAILQILLAVSYDGIAGALGTIGVLA
jgi:NADH-quinone oxidoreductase subunit H